MSKISLSKCMLLILFISLFILTGACSSDGSSDQSDKQSSADEPQSNSDTASSGQWTTHAPLSNLAPITPENAARLVKLATVTTLNQNVTALALSADASLLAIGLDNGQLQIWNVALGSQIATLQCPEGSAGFAYIYSVAFDPTSNHLAYGCPDTLVRLWDVTAQSEVAAFSNATEIEDQKVSSPTALNFSPDGGRLAAGTWRANIAMWDIVSSVEIPCKADASPWGNWKVAFSPDLSQVALSKEASILIQNTSSGDEILGLRERGPVVLALAFSPDGTRLAYSKWGGVLYIVQIAGGESLQSLTTSQPAVAVTWSPDGSLLATSGQLWDITTGQNLFTFEGLNPNRIVFDAHGTTLAMNNLDSPSTLTLWGVPSS